MNDIVLTALLTLCAAALTLYFFHLFPYRNRLSVWYMRRYHPGYRRAKDMYDLLIKQVEACKTSSVNLREGYYKFLEYMREESNFRSTEEIRVGMEGEVSEASTIGDFQNGFEAPDLESFAAFVGGEKEFHKIVVRFWFANGIHLHGIQLFYHEEHGYNSFYFSLEEKKFPPDDSNDGNGRRRRIIIPPPMEKILVES